MILCYDEKTKEAIEKTGMMVIEFKRMVYRMSNIMETIKKMGKTVAKALNDIFEKAKGVLNHFSEAFWETLEEYAGTQKRRWRLVRALDKLCNGVNTKPAAHIQPAYHCRSNC